MQPNTEGRYDIGEDLDEALASIRGMDVAAIKSTMSAEAKLRPFQSRMSVSGSSVSSTPRNYASNKKSTGGGSSKTQRNSRSTEGKKAFKDSTKEYNNAMFPNMAPPSYFTSYAPYGMPPMGMFPMAASNNQNRPPPTTATAKNNQVSLPEPKLSPMACLRTPASSGKTLENAYPGSTARKSIFDFDTPRSLGVDGLGMCLTASPAHMSVQGMSPPISSLKDTFNTPGARDDLPNLSPEDAATLNKTLFSADMALSPLPSTPPKEPVAFYIGSDSTIGKGVSDMRVGSRVSVSPIQKGAQRSGFFDIKNELKSTLLSLEASDSTDGDRSIMPPPTAPRVRNAPKLSSSAVKIYKLNDLASSGTPYITQDTPTHKIDVHPTPFDGGSLIKKLSTPSTEATVEASFWSDQGMSPVPFSMSTDPKRSSTDSFKTGMSPMQKKKRIELVLPSDPQQ